MQKKIAFIGPMGCGKSSIAAAYGERHNKVVYDVDEKFTRCYGDISAYFAAHGEEAFRKIEDELLIKAAKSDFSIIACGGGSVLCESGMAAIRSACDIVYLTAPQEILLSRIGGSDRPLKARAEEIFSKRKTLYERYADYTVSSASDIESTVRAVEAAIKLPRGNRYDVMLCDADDTVLDFKRAMRFAIAEAARAVGVKASAEQVIAGYEHVLPIVWGSLERGEITRDELASVRFKMVADYLGESFSPQDFNAEYIRAIKTTRFVRYGALEFLDEVRARGIKVYVITNSYKAVASERLKALDGHIDGSFVSEDIGFDKPDVRFFEWVAKSVGVTDKARVVVFGDGVFPDIHGGAAFGVDTCLYDPSGSKHTDEALYTVRSYAEFSDVL